MNVVCAALSPSHSPTQPARLSQCAGKAQLHGAPSTARHVSDTRRVRMHACPSASASSLCARDGIPCVQAYRASPVMKSAELPESC